jgi:hypothetical protein
MSKYIDDFGFDGEEPRSGYPWGLEHTASHWRLYLWMSILRYETGLLCWVKIMVGLIR